MKKYLMLILTAFLFSGCAPLTAQMNLQAGPMSIPENVFNGVYKGYGVRLDNAGYAINTFSSTLKAYQENGAIYMQETIVDNAEMTRKFTFRITKNDDRVNYNCVEVETLRSCSLFRSGDSIVLRHYPFKVYRSENLELSVQSVYQLLPDGNILKRSALSRFFYYFTEEEITSYKKEL